MQFNLFYAITLYHLLLSLLLSVHSSFWHLRFLLVYYLFFYKHVFGESYIKSTQKPSVKSLNLFVPAFKVSDPQFGLSDLKIIFWLTFLVCNETNSATLARSFQTKLQIAYDVLSKPDPERPYDVLKQAVIKSIYLADQQTVDQLLNQVQMGDRTPSQLTNYIKSLLGDRKVDRNLFYQLWLCQLPSGVQQIPAVGDTDIHIDNISKIADLKKNFRPIKVASEG